jgi:hypothetical protein
MSNTAESKTFRVAVEGLNPFELRAECIVASGDIVSLKKGTETVAVFAREKVKAIFDASALKVGVVAE